MKVSVYAQAWASATVNVELTQDELEKIAKDLEKDVADLTEDDIQEVAEEKAYSEVGFPDLCIQCSGYTSYDKFSMDLGDFEPVDENPVKITER